MFRTEIYENMYIWKINVLQQYKTTRELKDIKSNALRSCKHVLIEFIWPPKMSIKKYIKFKREEITKIIDEYNMGTFKNVCFDKVCL